MAPQKRVLVIGGTGAQGFAVVQALLHASPPFAVRVLSRNPEAPNVQSTFAGLSVEFAQGSFMEFDTVKAALQDCYGVYVNTDGFTVNEPDELWAGVRIFEIANSVPTLRHFVYGSIDYYLQHTGFNMKYGAHHTNGKGRVNAYLQSQPSSTSGEGLTWTILNTAVYDEDLFGGPLMAQIDPKDGTRTFAFPLDQGHLPLLTLQDLGVFALKVFENRDRWSGKTLNLASHFATGPELAQTLSKVAGVKAVYKNISIEEWTATLPFANAPVASTDPKGITVGQNFAMWWPGFQDSVLLPTRDMRLLREVNPDVESLEGWMRRVGYDGTRKGVLKGWIDAGIGPKA